MNKKNAGAWTPEAQSVFDWIGTLSQPVYTLKELKNRRSRHPRWQEAVNAVRRGKFGATDGQVVAALDAVLARLTSAPAPDMIVIVEDKANADWLIENQRSGRTPDLALDY